MSGCGDSSVERRQLEVRSHSNYFAVQTKTDATALGKGREAGTSPFVVHIFMRGVILQLFVIFSIHIFCRCSRDTSTDFLTAVGTYRLPATNGLSVQSNCLIIEN
jgi:hypothetical protein